MEYGALIRRAWSITWRTPFLWVLGILAGGAVGIPTINVNNSGESPWAPPTVGDVQIATAMTWAAENTGLLIGIGLVLALMLVTLVILSFIAQGGMAQATAALAIGDESSLARAWSAGVRLFWRYVGLWLALVGVAVVASAVVGAAIAAAVAAGALSQNPGVTAACVIVGWMAFVGATVAAALRLTQNSRLPRWQTAIGAALFAAPVIPILIALGLTVSIVVAFAQRAIAIEDLGSIDALKSGWRITRGHFGDSLVTWLVNVGLAIAATLAAGVLLIATMLLLGGVGALLFGLAGMSAPTVAYISLGLIVLFVGVLALAGFVNTFFWTYWTLAYLRLSGQQA